MYSRENVNRPLSRRQFIGGTMAVAAITTAGRAVIGAEEKKPVEYSRKIKIGIIGGGHRGNFVGGFIKKHGGYEIHAVADYFPEVAEKLGDNFGVDKSRRFSSLSGYKKVIESGVEALAILDVPYFYPEQARAAVDAGCHVYVAKPVAVDVPGTLMIGAAAEEATKKNRCFLVDYQLPLDQANSEVIKRIREGGLGGLAHILSFGKTAAWADPPKGPTIEDRLQHVIWLSDITLSGDTIVSYDIHIIDGLMAALGKRVVSATGSSRICRPEPHGDRVDACGVVFEFDDGALWTHVTQSLKNNADYSDLSASLFGISATAHIAYGGKVYMRGGEKHFVGDVSKSIYTDGAGRNVADFYSNITKGHFENLTVKRAVDGHLTSILGREAAARHTKLTMAELIKENKKLKVDLTGLKV
ncbi:MAG: Gfo/Idh/MocA family oxidoreductase [Kiritimatiellae bacterium]|nr:Gfo/Idh/MocA family oxidoreductase [Kiritimatiellia bacterium]MDD5519821.1 Gfo/Idh/MocA family oxidoreductase [Kiritimatiellia bacterium]